MLSLGAMLMGSRTDEATSFAILDRFIEADGGLLRLLGLVRRLSLVRLRSDSFGPVSARPGAPGWLS